MGPEDQVHYHDNGSHGHGDGRKREWVKQKETVAPQDNDERQSNVQGAKSKCTYTCKYCTAFEYSWMSTCIQDDTQTKC